VAGGIPWRSGHFRYDDGVPIGAELLDMAEPTALLSLPGATRTAAGVLEAARARGPRGIPPEDLARRRLRLTTPIAQPVVRRR
jgi:hypothetical protein